jgi:hypothetical protein
MRPIRLLGLTALLALVFLAGCERKVINEASDQANLECFTCHGEDGYILQAQGEWANSVHASGSHVDYTNRAGTDCVKCHNHRGFLEFLSTGAVSPPYSSVSSIHCFTCHAPHTTGNLGLRTTASVNLANGDIFDHGNGNLCARCHQARMSAETITDDYKITSNRWGPHHSQQADIVNGSNCFEIEGYEYDKEARHANLIEDACAGCHMGNVQANDGYRVGGHSFNMTDEESGTTLVPFCAQSGCHSDKSRSSNYDFDGKQTKIDSLMEELHEILVERELLAFFYGTDWLPNVPTGDTLFIEDKNIVGALFNYLMIEGDRSRGVHNYDYVEDVLESSIDYLKKHPQSGIHRKGFGVIASH